jgi:hypothetical protein
VLSMDWLSPRRMRSRMRREFVVAKPVCMVVVLQMVRPVTIHGFA